MTVDELRQALASLPDDAVIMTVDHACCGCGLTEEIYLEDFPDGNLAIIGDGSLPYQKLERKKEGNGSERSPERR